MSSQRSTALPFLDCTFRDGGYYTNWEFSEVLRSRLLALVDSARLSHVELGFRFLKYGPFGPFAFTSEKFLDSMDLPETSALGVMINADEYIDAPKTNIRTAFNTSDESRLSFVRIATHIVQLDRIKALVDVTRNLGYEVHLNLMQASHAGVEDIVKLAEIAQDSGVDYVYLADSLGSMRYNDFAWRFQKLREEGVARTGVHAHNNRGMATEISIQLLQENLVDLADATLRGIGRGAGNAVLEDALMLFGQLEAAGSFTDLSAEHLSEPQHRLGWGPSSAYLAAAIHQVHPSYPQEWREGESFSDGEIVRLSPSLGKFGGRTYVENSEWSGFWLLGKNTSGPLRGDAPSSSGLDLMPGKSKALLIGTGNSPLDHIQTLNLASQDDELQVVFLNMKAVLPQLAGDPVLITCNPLRFFLDYDSIRDSGIRLFAPVSQFKFLPDGLSVALEALPQLTEVPVELNPQSNVGCKGKAVTVPFASSLAYAIGVCLLAGITDVRLAGMDGYSPSDPRKSKMSELISKLSGEARLSLVSLTPTQYPLRVDRRVG